MFKITSSIVLPLLMAMFFSAETADSPMLLFGKLIIRRSDTSSLGFTKIRKYESMFLISALSKNLKPPYILCGMLYDNSFSSNGIVNAFSLTSIAISEHL